MYAEDANGPPVEGQVFFLILTQQFCRFSVTQKLDFVLVLLEYIHFCYSLFQYKYIIFLLTGEQQNRDPADQRYRYQMNIAEPGIL